MSDRFEYKVRLKRNSLAGLAGARVLVARVRRTVSGLPGATVFPYGSKGYLGMFAKQITDVMVVVRGGYQDLAILLLLERIPRTKEIELGPDMPGRRMLRQYDRLERPKGNIHVVSEEYWKPSFERSITELLRSDRDLRLSYSYAKRFIVGNLGDDPRGYGEAKAAFLSWALSVREGGGRGSE